MHLFCGPTEVLMRGHSHEVVNLPQFHSENPRAIGLSYGCM